MADAGRRDGKRADGLERLLALRLRVEMPERLVRPRELDSSRRKGRIVRVCLELAEHPGGASPHLERIVTVLDLEVGAQDLEDRPIGGALPVGGAVTLQPRDPLTCSDSWNSYRIRDLPTPASPTIPTTWPCPAGARSQHSPRRLSSRPSPRQCSGRADADLQPTPPARRPVTRRPRPARRPPTATSPRIRCGRSPSTSPMRGLGDQNRAWLGESFHSRREVRGVPDRRVVHAQVVADRPRSRGRC